MRFAGMFALWAGLVEQGVLEVNSEGFAMLHGWLTDPETKNDQILVWATDSRQCRCWYYRYCS